MYTIKQHTNEIVSDPFGWSVVCDGVALWKGLPIDAAQTILRQLGNK